MMQANSPTEIACEPAEEAHQPLQNIMPPVPNTERKTMKINFADDEKSDSQTASTYKEALSQPPYCISHRERLLWLQKRRVQGLYVQCDECSRWRYLDNVIDRHELPKKWYCRMNPDKKYASCSVPEVPISIYDEEDLIYSEYSAGSLVVARLDGWPWWPAMVDDCPDTEQYYWLDGFSDIPTHYNVVFFDSCEVTRAWVAPSQIKPYKEGKKLVQTSLMNKKSRKRVEAALKQANDAEKLTQSERLNNYSFIARYKGKIVTPKKIDPKEIRKHQAIFKRRYSIAFSPEISDTEEENQPITETPKKRKDNTPAKTKRLDKRHEVGEGKEKRLYNGNEVGEGRPKQLEKNIEVGHGQTKQLDIGNEVKTGKTKQIEKNYEVGDCQTKQSDKGNKVGGGKAKRMDKSNEVEEGKTKQLEKSSEVGDGQTKQLDKGNKVGEGKAKQLENSNLVGESNTKFDKGKGFDNYTNTDNTSLAVQVDTNSDLANTASMTIINDTSTTDAADSSVPYTDIIEETLATLDWGRSANGSPGSGDFDF